MVGVRSPRLGHTPIPEASQRLADLTHTPIPCLWRGVTPADMYVPPLTYLLAVSAEPRRQVRLDGFGEC